MLPALVRETCGVHRPSLTEESETEVVSLSAPQRILLVRVCSCAEHEERLVFQRAWGTLDSDPDVGKATRGVKQ